MYFFRILFFTAYHFQIQKSATFQNTPCCVLITFNLNGFGNIWRICGIDPPLKEQYIDCAGMLDGTCTTTIALGTAFHHQQDQSGCTVFSAPAMRLHWLTAHIVDGVSMTAPTAKISSSHAYYVSCYVRLSYDHTYISLICRLCRADIT